MSPARRGAVTVGTGRPAASAKAATISRTEVPCPVPRLKAWQPRPPVPELPPAAQSTAARWARARSVTWI